MMIHYHKKTLTKQSNNFRFGNRVVTDSTIIIIGGGMVVMDNFEREEGAPRFGQNQGHAQILPKPEGRECPFLVKIQRKFSMYSLYIDISYKY